MLYFETVEDRLMLSSVAAANPLDAADPRLTAHPNLSVTIPLQSPLITRALAISSFSLVDATTNQSLGTLTQGETIDLAKYPKHALSIVANAKNGHVGSVMFGYDGQSDYNIENYLPYSLIGNGDSQYSTWTPTPGEHTITAVGYSRMWGNGNVGKQLSIDFNVINSAAVTQLSLVDADTSKVLEPLVDGSTINLADFPTRNLSVVASTNPGTVGSVVFGYDDNESYRTENFLSYSLSGNNGHGYYSWTPTVGSHTVTATPYSAELGQGSAGTPLSINFNVTDTPPTPVNVTGFELFDLDTNTSIETLQEGEYIDLASLPTPNVAIVADTDSAPGSLVFGIDSASSFQTVDSAPFGLDAWRPTIGPHTVTGTAYTDVDGNGIAGTPFSLDFTIVDSTPVSEPIASVVGFTLVDADNGHTLGPLVEGETLDLTTLPTQNLEVVASTDSTNAGSLVFDYDDISAAQIENFAPYTFGPWTPALGPHTIVATAYPEENGAGEFGGVSLVVDFNVVQSTQVQTPASVSALNLVDNDTGQFLGAVTDGETIDLGSLPTQNVSIVAAMTDNTPVGSVVFGFDDNADIQTSDAIPYALNAPPLTLGAHRISATPFSNADGAGTAGTGLSVDFTVINTTAVTGFTLVDTDNAQPIMSINNLMTIDLGSLPTQNLAIAATTNNTTVGSVLYNYDGNATPLEATQDLPSGTWLPSIGVHTLTATPYSGPDGTGVAGAPLTVTFKVIDSEAVRSFSLINSDTGQVLKTLINGSTIDLSQLSGQNLAISANTSPSAVGSIVFGYDGNSNSDIEDGAPYRLAAWIPITGTHTITATPFSGPDAGGFAGTSLSINFSVINSTAVTGFTLVNADTGQSLGALTEGETLDLHTLPTRDLNVVATTVPTPVGSVVFGYDTTANFRLDDSAPYSLTGSLTASWTPAIGPHTITATPYAGADAGGLAGVSRSVDFNVIDSTPVNPPPNNDPDISVSITNPINGEAQAGPGYFVIRTATADTDGPLSKVDFYINGNLLGEANAQPYSMAWENAAPGTYTLTAVATDAIGSTLSAPVSVTITAPVVARTLYVSPGGSNSNNGLSQGSALQTITAAANMAKPGDTVLIEPGTYRETVSVPTGGTETNPITFAAAQPGTVFIDGADPLGGWTPAVSSNPIFSTGWNHDFFHGSTRYYFGLSTDGTTTAVGYAEQFLFNGKPLMQVLSASTMTAGTFYIDYTARTVSVWLPGGATPTSSNMLASTRSHLFVPASTSVQYIRVDGLIFQHAANFAQDEAVQTATGWRVLNSTIQAVNAGALDVKGNDNVVYNVHALNNGCTGIDGTGSNNLYVFDETAGNNYKGFSTFNEAGGGKFAKSDGAYFDQWFGHDNVGPGLWFDYQNTNYVVTNGYFYNNKPRVQNYEGIGIQIEISEGPGRVQNNTFYGNTGAALDICESMNVTAENNFFHNSYLEFRDLPNRGTYHIQNIHVADNEFDNSFIATSNGTWTSTSAVSKQIFVDGDIFNDTGPLVYWNGTGYKTLSAVFNTLGLEQHGLLGAVTFVPAPAVV